jgi:predicted signal transduction protein with EAL and GGDEF domain
VLRLVAARLGGACRHGDLLARLGGDEFAVVLADLDSVEAATTAAARFLDLFEEALETEGFPVLVRASAGVAVYPEHGKAAELLLHRADEAMYSAKRGDGGTRLYHPGRNEASIGRLGLLADLVGAMGAEELYLDYQPQISLATGDVVGVEALVRWHHPTVGRVAPTAFMPLAEQTDLIGPLTEWILRRALQESTEWRRARPFRLAVNISVRNLQDRDFVQTVVRALEDTGVSPSSLLLEITENTVGLDRSTARAVLRDLRDLGIAMSIDDFGTGYSSVSQLRDLPVDQVKLDRLFVANMACNPRDALIVRTMIQLGAALGLETVAEGVEDALVAEMLRDLGCDQAQGYLIARPMSADDLSRWLGSLDRWELPVPADAPPVAS